MQNVQSAGSMAADKQWKPASTLTVPTLRMPPGLALPTSSQQQQQQPPVSHLQPGSVPSNSAGWPKRAELPQELTGAGKCHTVVPGVTSRMTGGQDNVIANDEYQRQQQALLLAQVQATLRALQSCPQQPVSADQFKQASLIPQRPAEQSRFGIAGGNPEEPPAVMDSQRPMFVNGKDACLLPVSATPNATSTGAYPQLQQGKIMQQGQMLGFSKCMVNSSHNGETGVTMQPFPGPQQQAFMQTMGPSASRRLLPTCFQNSSQPFLASPAVPLNVSSDSGQLEPNQQLLVQGPPSLRCSQSAWTVNNARQSPYPQYCVPSSVSPEQYNMVGRLTPVMTGPAGDVFCSSIPSQVCTMPSSLMIGSKFPRYSTTGCALAV